MAAESAESSTWWAARYVRYLLRLLDLRSYDQAIATITKYYPIDEFPQKTLYALTDLLPKPD